MCNSRWSQDEGGEVWCDGTERVPRKVPADNKAGTRARCGCFDIRYALTHPELTTYAGCYSEAQRCQTQPPQPRKPQ
ncbi:unnamed protein product [Phaeothamnion confervicola]